MQAIAMNGLSTFDLKQRASNFEQHAKVTAEKERRKAEKERIQQERAAARRAAHEAAVAEVRQKQLEAAEQAEQQRQEDLEHNKGVSITATLTAAPLSTAVAAAKGVKRHEDKVILPASLSSELMKQRAFEHGQLFWRISARDGRSTVASALEFTAPEGVIMLPPKVTKGLWGLDGEPHGEVRVSYHRLEPGTFVAFTPQSKDFQKAVQEADVDLEALLQGTLMQHTALSEGDWISVTVPALVVSTEEAQPGGAPETDAATPSLEGGSPGVMRGSQQWLQVCSLKPHPHVSLVDTDLEAEVTPSAEFMERVAAEQAAARVEAERIAALEAEEARRQAEASAAAAADAQLKATIAAQRRELAATLPPEIPADCQDPVLRGMFQLPDGSRIQRRFLLSSSVSQLFDFTESIEAGGFMPGGYRIVTRYPRRVLEAGGAGTLAEAGFGPGQEVFVLEAVGTNR